MPAIHTVTVLAQEAVRLRGMGAPPEVLALADETTAAALMDDEAGLTAAEKKKREKTRDEHRHALYTHLNGQNLSALCLSGGGIRSAAFSLGVVQALATHPRTVAHPTPAGYVPKAATAANASGQLRAADVKARVATPEESLLAQFDYLSTVSGGGYCGSFLNAWLRNASFETVWTRLVFSAADQTDVSSQAGTNSDPLRWLRNYSNYLSPKVGLMSVDTWAAATITLRNLVLNWLVIVPPICAILALLKMLMLFSVGLATFEVSSRPGSLSPPETFLLGWPAAKVAALAESGLMALLLAYAIHYSTSHRPTRYSENRPSEREKTTNTPVGVTQTPILYHFVLPSVLAAMLFTQAAASTWLLSLATGASTWLLEPSATDAQTPSMYGLALCGATVGGLIYLAGNLIGTLRSPPLKFGDPHGAIDWSIIGLETAASVVAGLVAGGLLGTVVFFYALPQVEETWVLNDLMLPLLFGVPAALVAQAIGDMVYVGLTSSRRNSENDREWLGRASSWLLVIAVAWFVVILLAFAGSLLVRDISKGLPYWLAPLGGVSGLATAVIGRSSLSAAQSGTRKRKALPGLALILDVAAMLFAATLVISLSALLDVILLDATSVEIVRLPEYAMGQDKWCDAMRWLGIGLGASVSVAVVASNSVNINRFSLHAMYRNRLIRAFLGASNPTRRADAFTDFATEDDPRVHDPYWTLYGPVQPRGSIKPRGPFHVVNMALNVVSTKRLAWQERKAEPFTATPLHTGGSCVGFRPSQAYGGPGGIKLGTAMAISGAAASPNMGYHSSPAVTFLLALFNVRLGWWLGNPGKAGDQTHVRAGPGFAIWPLLAEMFGHTDHDNKYVYLSDGGHFENLGLYEMVRRRCRTIVVVDAGADRDFAFEDLGNATRKIFIDFGIPVYFDDLDALKPRPAEGELGSDAAYCAVGRIDYPLVDPGSAPGVILYVKPGYHGIESAGIRSYAIANPDFPHQSTGDQFFSESQFESYRGLGFEIVDKVLLGLEAGKVASGRLSLRDLLGTA